MYKSFFQITAAEMEVNKNDFDFDIVFRWMRNFFYFFPKYKLYNINSVKYKYKSFFQMYLSSTGTYFYKLVIIYMSCLIHVE